MSPLEEGFAEPPEESETLSIDDRVWQRYMRTMTRWAMRALQHVKEVRGSFEDVVASALRTRERQEQEGELPAPEATKQLWEQLKVCLNKKIDQYKGVARNQYKDNFVRDADRQSDPDRPPWVEGLIAGNLTPEDVDAYVQDGMEVVDAALIDPQMREIARLIMMSHTTTEMAAKTGLSEHQVRRRVVEIRKALERYEERQE